METFKDFLSKRGYKVSSTVTEMGEVLVINGDIIKYTDIPKSKYARLMREYHFSNK